MIFTKIGCFQIVLLQLLFLCLVRAGPLTCHDHPAYSDGFNPVLVSSWTPINARRGTDADYHPRYTSHRFAPLPNENSTVYEGLDWFYASNYEQPNTDNFIRLNLHRPAKVFLVVAVSYDRDFPPATLKDWDSEGWARRVDELENEFTVGVHQRATRWLPEYVYIFSRNAGESATLPSQAWVKDNISGVKPVGSWYVMLAEIDGSASLAPTSPSSVVDSILPNKRCPDELHALWVTPETDESDPDVKGRMWPTWHPQWDPCYWCAYDHEHGSSALHLMNYAPRFGYTPWKNGREEESHAGFKCTVFKTGDYYVCFCIHAQTSSLRRVDTRSHSIIFVVADAETKDVLAEVTHKGFFGFIGTRKKGGGFVGITKEEETMQQSLRENGWASNKRSVNVIDVDNLNPSYEYNDDLLRGRYEEWSTNPICSGRGRRGMLNMDMRNPITGVVSAERSDESVNLGFERSDKFIRHDGSSRLVHMREFQFGEDHCIFPLRDIFGGRSVNGTFYTDASGQQLMSGPGEGHIRQYVKPGFKFEMSGHYDMVEPWGGELVLDADSGQSSDGYGLDPRVN